MGAAPGDLRLAVVAVGSYGRRELAPHSDVDLLLLHDVRNAGEVEKTARALLYPLWDAGFELGYAVRSPPQCLDLARADPTVATTLLDARLVCGDPRPLDRLRADLGRWLRRHRRALEAALASGLSERHRRFGDAGVDLEPHLKEARGGLRDLQTLRWLGTEPEAELTGPLDLLLEARSVLHERYAKRQDRLHPADAAPLAEALGFPRPGDDLEDPRDALMRAVFTACRDVGVRLTWATRPAGRPPRSVPEGFAVADGRLARTGAASPTARPEAPLAAAAVAGALPPARETLAWTASDSGPIPWNDAARDSFLGLLRDADPAAWEFLDHCGLWPRYLPELAGCRARTQHNPVHRLAVDAHAWETLAQVRRLRDDPEMPLAATVFSELTDPDVLTLAALLHDAGKGSPGHHSRAGVVLARRACQRMGFGADVEEAVAYLVQDHLVLTDTATQRDLNDEELVYGLAARIGGPQVLRHLYLLTIADARATGPAAWSEWKSHLLGELYVKLVHILDTGDLVGREIQNRIERKRGELGRVKGEPELSQALDQFPRRYLATQPAEMIACHLESLADPPGDGEFRLILSDDGTQLSVVARDHPGLLSLVTGGLAACGIDVRTADVYTRPDGYAVDVLTVADSHDAAIAPEKWARVHDVLRADDLAARLAARAAHYRPSPRATAVEVTVDNAVSDWYSVVDVVAPDRIGLLHHVTAVLADAGLDVHFAKVLTQAGLARDSFSVRDRLGRKVESPRALAADLRGQLTARLLLQGGGEPLP